MMATAPSYMAPGSEFDLAQQQAARQHLLAQSLMQQSQQPLQGQMVGEYYAAPSWTQGLAKMLQGYTAGQMNRNADQSLLDARSAYDTRNMNSSNDFIDQLTGTPAQSFPSPSNDAGDTSQVTRPAQAADPNAALKIAMQNPQNPTLAGMGQSMLANKLSLAQTQSLFNMATGSQGGAPSQPQGGVLPGMGAFLSQGGASSDGSADAGPTSTSGAAPSGQPGTSQGGMQGVNPMAARLMMTGNPGLAKLGDAMQSAYQKSQDPVVNRGFGIGRMVNGQYVPDAASLDQALAMKTGETGIANQNTILDIPNADGTSRQVTKAGRLAELNPGQIPNSGSGTPDAGNMTAIKADIAKNGNPSPTLNWQNVGQSTSDKAFANEQGKTLAEYESKINTDAGAAISKMAQNNKMVSLIPDITTGPIAKQITALKNLTSSLGVSIGDPSSNQEFEKYAIKGALEGAKQIYGARLTNQDVMSQIMSNPGSTMADKALYQLIQYDNIGQQRMLDKQKAYYEYEGPKPQFEMRFNRDNPFMGIAAPSAGQTAEQTAPAAAVPSFTKPATSSLVPAGDGTFHYVPSKK